MSLNAINELQFERRLGVAEAGERATVTTATSEAAAIQSFVNVLGFNKVLAPAFLFLSPSIDLHRLKQQNSNNEFFFIGFHQSCSA
jgi:hypothetical protein